MPVNRFERFAHRFFVGFIFQYVMRRRHFRWWSKFNFVLSAGLEGGTIVAGVLIFLCLQLPRQGTIEVCVFLLFSTQGQQD